MAKRDEQVRRYVRCVRDLVPHLENPVYAPMLQSFARISLLLERGYSHLREGSLLNKDGELRPGIDTIRRLAETQSRLARELGLTPATLRSLAREKPGFDIAAEATRADDDAEE